MEAYEIFKKLDEGDESHHIARSLMIALLFRASEMIKNETIDIPSKIKSELIIGNCIFDHTSDSEDYIRKASEDYYSMSRADRKYVDITFRDILSSYYDEIGDAMPETSNDMVDILDQYIDFKISLDTVDPEVSAKVDQMVNMTDEEFASMQTSEYNPDYDIPDEKLYQDND